MNTMFLVAAALVIRHLVPVDGSVAVRVNEGEKLVSAYSAVFEHVWNHADPKTVVDRLGEATGGRVTGLGADEHLVVALIDGRKDFDLRAKVTGDPDTFPWDDRLPDAYRKLTGRDYSRDMMELQSPFLGDHDRRRAIIADMYAAAMGLFGITAEVRRFGSGSRGRVLVGYGYFQARCWTSPAYGDDCRGYAEKFAAEGYRVTHLPSTHFARLAVDGEGYLVFEGERYDAFVAGHLGVHEAEILRGLYGTGKVKTRLLTTDAPLICGAEIFWLPPEL